MRRLFLSRVKGAVQTLTLCGATAPAAVSPVLAFLPVQPHLSSLRCS